MDPAQATPGRVRAFAARWRVLLGVLAVLPYAVGFIGTRFWNTGFVVLLIIGTVLLLTVGTLTADPRRLRGWRLAVSCLGVGLFLISLAGAVFPKFATLDLLWYAGYLLLIIAAPIWIDVWADEPHSQG
jgi:hypothetical protein